MDSFDLLVVGGGINGAAIARDAAMRGAKVLLVEKDDLAAHTSSASSKLIHGGLRYLEYGEFRLVREALAEREILLRTAPHIVRPLQFVLPHCRGLRPSWMIRAGLWLYDLLALRGSLPRSRRVGRRRSRAPLSAQGASADPLLLGREGRRFPPRRAQRGRRRRARRRDRHPNRIARRRREGASGAPSSPAAGS
jgi:glycerol-3-phosphate dehydrogenase